MKLSVNNPFALSRRNARRLLKKNVAKTADKVNEGLAGGNRHFSFPPGLADAAVQMFNEAGGWQASVRERGEESSRVVVKEDPTASRTEDCPFISCATAKVRSFEHIGKAATQIHELLCQGIRAFVFPIGIVDDLVRLLCEPGTGWKAEITRRDEDDQMNARFVVSDADGDEVSEDEGADS